MRSAKDAVAVLLLLLTTGFASAESDAERAVAPAATAPPALAVVDTVLGTPTPPHTLTLRSTLLDETRRIYIQLPHGYERSGQSYPVLVVLDGEWLFELARAHVRFYSEYEAMHIGLPQMIVVGIENIDRDRDFTPTANSGTEYLFESAGQADRFLEFLDQELLPLIDRDYRTVPSRTLAGWSFSGLFTFYTAITRPDLFDGYLCISPAVWWDKDLPLNRLRKIEPARNKRMVLTLGSKEDGGWVHTSSKKLLAALEDKPIRGLSLQYIELPGVGHSWGVSSAMDKGLQTLFEGYIAPDEIQSQGLKAIDAYYADLSTRWHYPVRAPYTVLQNLVLAGWSKIEKKETLLLLREIVRRYPTDPSAHYFLGRMLSKLDRHDEALASLETALALETSRTQPRHLKAMQFEDAVSAERDRGVAETSKEN